MRHHKNKQKYSFSCIVHKLCATSAFVVLAAFAGAPAVMAREPVKQFNIPAQEVQSALNEFARQSDRQILFSTETTGIKRTEGVQGELEPEAALTRLLKGTGLTYRVTSDNTILVENPKSSANPSAANHGLTRVAGASGAGGPDSAQDRRSGSGAAGTNNSAAEVQEIVVTAQKREERLQDVPVPVTALDARTLTDNNQLRIQDYYTKVPGLNLTLLGDIGQSSLSIRGLTTGGNVLSTVGVVVDDIPFGPSIYVANGSFAPDFDPGELARVEVLRGPQGTLYGANSLGGLLKFVTVDPSTDALRGNVQIGTSAVKGSDELGYSVRGAVNLPVSDTFALRASGSTRREPGYIDNLQTGREDVNDIESESIRLAALWRPSDQYSVKLSALYQDTSQNGTADTHLPSPLGPRPDLGELQQSTLINSGVFDQSMQAYSATVTAELGRAQLTSLSGYNIKDTFNALDTPLASLANASQTRFGVRGFVTQADTRVSKFTQEVRLTLPITSRVEWLLGGFYTHEKARGHSDWLAIDQNTGAVAGTWLVVDTGASYDEYAAFTDFTFQLSDRFDVQVGGRVSHNEIAAGSSTTAGPYNTVFSGLPSETAVTPEFESTDTPFSYLLSPRFKFSDDLMLYARFASGYRPGGPNTSAAAVAAGAPASYEADTTEAYEVGIKGSVFDRRLSFDASLYTIDWKEVQLQTRDPNNSVLQYTYNVGGAKSDGVELSIQLRPFDNTTLSAWGAYNDAELTDVAPNVTLNARPGNRLPYSARKSGHLSVEQGFPLWNSVVGHVGLSASYVGDRKGRFFAGTVVQGEFPAYTQLDLQLGAEFDRWAVKAFVNNLADKRGVLRGGRDASLSLQYIVTYIQPRTAGLTLSRSF